MKPSTKKLYDAVAELNEPRLKKFLKQIEKGYYHEYDSDLDFPMFTLALDCAAYGLDSFIRRVVDGEFDATREEGLMWRNSLDGMEAFHDERAIADVRAVAMAVHAAEGVPWNEEDWQKFISEGRIGGHQA